MPQSKGYDVPVKDKRNIPLSKKKQHTLKNQLVVTSTGRIVSVSRFHTDSVHDKKVYDKTFIKTTTNYPFKLDCRFSVAVAQWNRATDSNP